MKLGMLIGALLFCGASALAQDILAVPAPPEPELPGSLTLQDPANLGRRGGQEPDFGLNAAFHLRYGIPFGAADRDVAGISGPGGTVIVVDQNLSWADLFDDGWSAELEVDVFMGTLREHGHVFRYGGYVSFAASHFEGDGVTDDQGRKMRPGDLDMEVFLVGGKIVQPTGENTFIDGRFGVGAVHYAAVSAVFSAPLVPAFETEFLEETWTFAFEVRGHGGLKLGPLSLVIGLGLSGMLPPDEGDGVDMSSGLLWVFDVDFGAELGF